MQRKLKLVLKQLGGLQARIRSATDRALLLALLVARDSKCPLSIRLLALFLAAALLVQVIMQSGLGAWNWADDGVRLLLLVLGALHLSLSLGALVLLASVLILSMTVQGVRVVRVANHCLLSVLDDVEWVEARA